MDNRDYIEAEDYFDMGTEWLIRKDYDKALEYFRHVIELNKNFIYAYIREAEIFAIKENYHDAVRVLRRAIKVDKEFDKLYYLIAIFLYKDKNYKHALEYIEEAINLNADPYYIKFKEQISISYSNN